MLSVLAQLVRLVIVTLLVLPKALPNPIRHHFQDILRPDEHAIDSVSNNNNRHRQLDFTDYQSDIYDNRITKDDRIINKLLRPSPSDELPNKDLIMPPTSKDKLPKDLDFKYVRKILGDDYDPDFMSDSRPLDSILKPNGSIDMDYKKVLPKEDLPDEIRHLTFNIPGRKNPMRIKSIKQRRKLRQRLWAHVSCPVVYKWKDLGQLFWPRWVKEGDCYKERSCSIPAGMKCQPSESTEKTFLFWHCSRNKTSCQWIKIHYPVITKCKCGC